MACCDYTGVIRFVYDWQTYIAGLLALGGGVLAYRAGVKQARATHRATEKSTQSMLERSQLVERAYISGGGVRARELVGISAQGTPIDRDAGKFQFHINNYGKTQGTLYRLGFEFCDEANIPDRPNYKFEHKDNPIDPGRRGLPIDLQPIPPEHAVPVASPGGSRKFTAWHGNPAAAADQELGRPGHNRRGVSASQLRAGGRRGLSGGTTNVRELLAIGPPCSSSMIRRMCARSPLLISLHR
jgi:hypothetical protein